MLTKLTGINTEYKLILTTNLNSIKVKVNLPVKTKIFSSNVTFEISYFMAMGQFYLLYIKILQYRLKLLDVGLCQFLTDN